MPRTTSKRCIVLVRGINVGKDRKLPMATLRQVCESAGCDDVATYIQSGNVVLDSPLPPDQLAAKLEDGIGDVVGFTPRVLVRQPADLARILDTHPFPDAEDAKVHVGFMSALPAAEAVAGLAEQDWSPEGFEVIGTEVFLHYPDGMGHSKLAAVPLERRLGVAVTVRNWRTVTKLHEMA